MPQFTVTNLEEVISIEEVTTASNFKGGALSEQFDSNWNIGEGNIGRYNRGNNNVGDGLIPSYLTYPKAIWETTTLALKMLATVWVKKKK
jgi:hypothetical protein